MAQIKVGDTVRAHLNADIQGKVVKITKERSNTWSATGPLEDATFCFVELSNGKITKVKITDLYIDY